MNFFGIILIIVAVTFLLKYSRDRARKKAQPPTEQVPMQTSTQSFAQMSGISIKNCQINQVVITNDSDNDDEDDDMPDFVAVTCPHCGASCRIPAEGGQCDYCNSHLNADL